MQHNWRSFLLYLAIYQIFSENRFVLYYLTKYENIYRQIDSTYVEIGLLVLPALSWQMLPMMERRVLAAMYRHCGDGYVHIGHKREPYFSSVGMSSF